MTYKVCEMCYCPLDWIDLLFLEKNKADGSRILQQFKIEYICLSCLNKKFQELNTKWTLESLG